jgi:hypothetical protein
MTWANPIGKGLTPERIDMGTDYGGSGPLYALGDGTVSNLYNSGWPGGTFLTVHLDSGQYIYYAEDIAPLVSIGQKVKAGQHIANATGGGSGIEVGWAAAPGTGAALAASAGQASSSGDPGEFSTAYGVAMSNVIAALGGPAGKVNPPVSGTVPSDFLSGLSSAIGKAITGVPSTTSATLDSATSSAGVGGILSWPGQITGFFSDADTFVTKLAWIVEPGSWLRIGSFLLAMILLIGAIVIFTHADEKIGGGAVPIPVPV